MDACLLFIESNTTGTGRSFALCARSLGYRPLVLTKDPSRYKFIEGDSITYVQVETSNPNELWKRVECIAKEVIVAGIYSSSEYFMDSAAELADAYGLPAADYHAVRECRNKHVQRRRLEAGGISVPRFRFAERAGDIIDALAFIPLPVVVKPICGSGSVGVRLCRTEAEVLDHSGFLLRENVNERGLLQAPGILIEEYLEGQEYSVEIFGNEVVGITRKHLSPVPYFVELGHDFPANLGVALSDRIAATALRACEVMGLNWGPIHLELKLTRTGPAIVEINPRLAGGFIPELVRLAKGIDLIRESICIVTGNPWSITGANNVHASIRFLLPSTSGRVISFEGIDQARNIPGVAEVMTYIQTGTTVYMHGDFRDRIGHVIACGTTEQRAARAVRVACSKINIHLSR